MGHTRGRPYDSLGTNGAINVPISEKVFARDSSAVRKWCSLTGRYFSTIGR